MRSTQKTHVSTHRQNKETTAKYSYILVTTNNNYYPFMCCFSTLEHVALTKQRTKNTVKTNSHTNTIAWKQLSALTRKGAITWKAAH